ncbi:MAG: response regulator [Anaerolineales bacterium]
MPDKIRVLIVDDFAETRESLRKLLQFEGDMEVVGTARGGKEAISLTKDTQPNVVIMDINMPDMDGIAATEAVLQVAPRAQVAILSVQSESDYIRRAMLAGARAFLTKPPSADELVATIRKLNSLKPTGLLDANVVEVGKERKIRREGKIVTIYSPKGGTGKTTLACNLAMILQTEDTPAALVDASLQYGDVAVFLNLQAKNDLADLAAQATEIDGDLVENVAVAHASGLRVFVAPATPEKGDKVHAPQLEKVLHFLAGLYQYVVVDTQSGLNDLTISTLDASDLVILVATPDIPSIKNVRLFYDVLEAIGYSAAKVLLVMNRVDKRYGITAEAVSDNLKQPVVCQIPLDERTLIPATNQGQPFMLGDRSRPIARAVLELAQAVRTRLAEKKEEEEEEVKKPARPRLIGARA